MPDNSQNSLGGNAGSARLGPFGYLRTKIREDIDAARAGGITADAALHWALELRRSPEERLAKRTAANLPSETRDCLEAALCRVTTSDDGHYLEHVFLIALDDPDSRVRGAAWLALASASCNPDNLPILLKLAVRAFLQRFNARPEFASQLEAGGRHWLWMLSQETNRAERERSASQTRAVWLEQLVGRCGPVIDALAPHDAANYLKHENASYRLAAIESLSRSVRVGAVNAAMVKRAIHAIGPQTAFSPAGNCIYEALPASVPDAEVYARRIREMATLDADHRVRSAAINALGLVYWQSADLELESFLARIAMDVTLPDHSRYLACQSLSMVHGLPFNDWPLSRAMSRLKGRLSLVTPFFNYKSAPDYDWNADIDWEFIHRCAEGTPC